MYRELLVFVEMMCSLFSRSGIISYQWGNKIFLNAVYISGKDTGDYRLEDVVEVVVRNITQFIHRRSTCFMHYRLLGRG